MLFGFVFLHLWKVFHFIFNFSIFDHTLSCVRISTCMYILRIALNSFIWESIWNQIRIICSGTYGNHRNTLMSNIKRNYMQEHTIRIWDHMRQSCLCRINGLYLLKRVRVLICMWLHMYGNPFFRNHLPFTLLLESTRTGN